MFKDAPLDLTKLLFFYHGCTACAGRMDDGGDGHEFKSLWSSSRQMAEVDQRPKDLTPALTVIKLRYTEVDK